MDSFAIVALVVFGVGAGGTAIALALRQSGIKTALSDEKRRTTDLERQLQTMSREYAAYRSSTKKQLAALRQDIEELDDDLSQCTTPGARRGRLERLLSKASDRSHGDDPPNVPGDGRPETGEAGQARDR